MNWKTLTIGKKITVGFGVVLFLLCVAGTVSYFGVADIVNNAEQVIAGNKLDGELAQREVDHLNWANAVNALLTNDKVTDLKVQTDPHKCGFGKWFYGEGRRHAEALAPSLKPLLAQIEEPHAKLHESAVEIKKVFRQSHHGLMEKLTEVLAAHLEWAGTVSKRLSLEAGGLNSYQSLLKSHVDQTVAMVGALVKDSGPASRAEQQAKVINMVRQMRYGPENKDYFFIIDHNGICILHPAQPEIEGKNMLGTKDPNGKSLFKDMVEVSKQKGRGFVTYYWPKPGGRRRCTQTQLYRHHKRLGLVDWHRSIPGPQR